MTLNYKSHDVLKTSGSVVKVGEYQGANFDSTGKPVPSKFGVTDIRRMHDNATEPIPIFVDLHGKGLNRRELAGWCFRLGMSPDGTELVHNGFVFNPKAQKLIASGHNQVSPEIETFKDAVGNIVDRKIEALCFVPNGAIDGQELNYMVEKFSTIDGMNGQTNTGNQDAGTTPPATTIDAEAIVKNTAKAVLAELMPATKAMIDEAIKGQTNTQDAEITQQQNASSGGQTDDKSASEIAQLKAQAAANQQVTDKLLNEKYEEIVAHVKKLGIPDPSSIVAGLPKLQAIETLTSVRANLLQNASLNGVPQGLSNQGVGHSQKTETQVFEECMSELGFNSDHYRNMFK